MNHHRRAISMLTLTFAAMGACLGGGPAHPTTSPSTRLSPGDSGGSLASGVPSRRAVDPVQQAFEDDEVVSRRLEVLLSAATISDPVKRAEIAPVAIPLLYYKTGLINVEGTLKTMGEKVTERLHRSVAARLYLLGDAPTVQRVQEMLASSTPSVKLDGQIVELEARWVAAEGNAEESLRVASELEALATANPEDSRIALMAGMFDVEGRSEAITAKMTALRENVMRDPDTLGAKVAMAARKKKQEDAAHVQEGLIGKPYVIAGNTVDGAPFSTANYKGKVVLVDFWATWCGPCVAGLPHLRDLYGKYHDKGLEIVGVSNDSDAAKVKAFTKSHDMPWVDLFDPTNAAAHEYSKLTNSAAVWGIPTTFLIDKKGILRGLCVGPMTLDDMIPKLLAE
jgi:peroxiredoxin